jgi:hypothetical protein
MTSPWALGFEPDTVGTVADPTLLVCPWGEILKQVQDDNPMDFKDWSLSAFGL